MEKNQYIGITEAGDPSFRLDIFDHLYDGNIIITKRLTDKLIEKLIEHKDKCILHFTVTGMGGTKIEPFVPALETSISKCNKLIENGFPVEQIVLRIDPVVPTQKGLETSLNVIDTFKDTGIKRLRISFLDMYKHVKERFTESNINLPYETFHANLKTRKEAYNALYLKANECGFTIIQTCGEPDFESTPCISQMDVDILGLTEKIKLIDEKGQRKNCHCPSNKKELIVGEKPHRCENNCLYCFWK